MIYLLKKFLKKLSKQCLSACYQWGPLSAVIESLAGTETILLYVQKKSNMTRHAPIKQCKAGRLQNAASRSAPIHNKYMLRDVKSTGKLGTERTIWKKIACSKKKHQKMCWRKTFEASKVRRVFFDLGCWHDRPEGFRFTYSQAPALRHTFCGVKYICRQKNNVTFKNIQRNGYLLRKRRTTGLLCSVAFGFVFA